MEGVFVGFDLPSDLVRAGGGWNRKKGNFYIIKTDSLRLERQRPDLELLEAIKQIESESKPKDQEHLQACRNIQYGLESWRKLLERRLSLPNSPLEDLKALEAESKALVEDVKKNPSERDISKKRQLKIIQAIEKLLPQDEKIVTAYNLATVDSFLKFQLDEMVEEKVEIHGTPCQILTVPEKVDHTYAIYPLTETSIFVLEFRDVQKNKLEDLIQPTIESVKIGLSREEVAGDDLLSQLGASTPKVGRKTKRNLVLLAFFLFCTVLPASVSAARNYPGLGAGEERRKECGRAVRSAVARTSGCSILLIGALVASAAAADMASGRGLGWGMIIMLVVGLLMLGLFWGVTLAAAFGAGLGAEHGAASSKFFCVTQAAGGAVAGALAIALMMLVSGV